MVTNAGFTAFGPAFAADALKGTRDTITGDEFRAIVSTTAEGATDHRQKFTEDMARMGRTIDLARTHASVIRGAAAVWEDGITIDQVDMLSGSDAAGKIVAHQLAVKNHADPASLAAGATTTGLGMDKLPDPPSGSTELLSGCWKITLIEYTENIVGCQQVYGSQTSYEFLINRWSVYNGTEISGNFDATVDSARMWNQYTSNDAVDTSRLTNFAPVGQVDLGCADAATITIPFGKLSVSIPVSSCSTINAVPDPTNHTMDVTYHDSTLSLGKRQVNLSSAMRVVDIKSMSLKNWDYAKFCSTECVGLEGWGPE